VGSGLTGTVPTHGPLLTVTLAAAASSDPEAASPSPITEEREACRRATAPHGHRARWGGPPHRRRHGGRPAARLRRREGECALHFISALASAGRGPPRSRGYGCLLPLLRGSAYAPRICLLRRSRIPGCGPGSGLSAISVLLLLRIWDACAPPFF